MGRSEAGTPFPWIRALGVFGNVVSIQYTQDAAELQQLSQANSFSSFIALRILLLFRERQRWNPQVGSRGIERTKAV